MWPLSRVDDTSAKMFIDFIRIGRRTFYLFSKEHARKGSCPDNRVRNFSRRASCWRQPPRCTSVCRSASSKGVHGILTPRPQKEKKKGFPSPVYYNKKGSWGTEKKKNINSVRVCGISSTPACMASLAPFRSTMINFRSLRILGFSSDDIRCPALVSSESFNIDNFHRS